MRVVTVLIALLIGCGGSRASTPATDRDGEPSLTLGPRMSIPGAGLSIEPPPGATLLPLGPGLEVPDLELTILVAIAEGAEPVREAFRRELFIDGEGARRADVTIENVGPATLGRDVLQSPMGALPRVWLIAERGDRTLALLATWRRGTDAELEPLVVASLSSVRWDPSATLSPSEAIGVHVGPVEGLSPDRATLGTLALTVDGARFPPPAGEPMAFLLPLAERTPETRTLEACVDVLDRAAIISEEAGEAASIEVEGSWGCERSGMHRTREGELLFAHGAVLFLPPGPVLLAAMVSPERRDEWAPRFSAAARTLRYLRGE